MRHKGEYEHSTVCMAVYAWEIMGDMHRCIGCRLLIWNVSEALLLGWGVGAHAGLIGFEMALVRYVRRYLTIQSQISITWVK